MLSAPTTVPTLTVQIVLSQGAKCTAGPSSADWMSALPLMPYIGHDYNACHLTYQYATKAPQPSSTDATSTLARSHITTDTHDHTWPGYR